MRLGYCVMLSTSNGIAQPDYSMDENESFTGGAGI